MKTNSAIRKIIEYGIMAPSGHNTQPWKFKIDQNEIQIYPDFTKSLPVVDADHHAMYISLGCAVENIVLAALNDGYFPEVRIVKKHGDAEFICIALQVNSESHKDYLYRYIKERQVTRNEYKDTEVSPEDLELLIDSTRFPGVQVRSFITPEEINQLEPLIIEGSIRQFRNKQFVEELVSWIRFSKTEIEKKKDGIWHASMGFPGTGKFLGNLIMKKFVSAESEAKRWKKLIRASAGFLLFIAEENDVTHWVNLGRAFQRFGLTACKLKISHAHVNMPCEEFEVREKMTKLLGIDIGYPLLLIRFGYSNKMPYSYRRPMEEVLSDASPLVEQSI
ncbi:Putative TM nitroreductase [Muriicola jejuensis]|uniref:Putative nitroreductase TM1586 domain-containing protein n=1 Tax=Muriicola jejuensis TaxID=504488 RepID=A0A6P0U9X5_9FLAO|nr:nitroreductase family protein [Muriicola jejuensis]NER10101.1 hypothetical protein [Muriicola jejuensis]SMP02893.1 Putative TM nitroreductase [Muriicola jejuensis]